jgi:nitric oxide reductase large subunit
MGSMTGIANPTGRTRTVLTLLAFAALTFLSSNMIFRRREMKSKKSQRIAMILVVVVMALLAIAQHFGWIAGPPPVLAPGIQ